MNIHKSFLSWVVCAIGLIACASSMPPAASTDSAVGRLYEESGELHNKKTVKVTANIAEFKKETFPCKDVLYWGAEGEWAPPKLYFEYIKVFVGEKKSWIPFSSYSDLFNIKSVNLEIEKNGFQLVVDGGQSATHYKAILYFDNEGFLTKRRVYSLEFEDEVWEETQYSFIRRADM